ncbi:MAG: Cytidylate kinase [candidate division TM6 bacterium GW2011_GWF2_38_10]|nr:MAG: Cytidylate kinase [candidate division TM6 bacterium GW2011_GWF2_38_10]
MIITIDGPVASGKSSVAKALAQRIGAYHVNTGLLYRAVAYILIHDFHITDLKKLARQDPADFDFIYALSYVFINHMPQIRYGEKDITPFLIRHKELDNGASLVSALPPVRERLLPVQQAIGKQYSIVADGRDCGTVVYPHADIKIFLTATLTARAQRVAHELQQKTGKEQNLQEIEELIATRDKRDVTRPVAPLCKAPDAYLFDNSDLTLEQTVDHLDAYIQQKKH